MPLTIDQIYNEAMLLPNHSKAFLAEKLIESIEEIESSIAADEVEAERLAQNAAGNSSWEEFIESTYGCLSDDQIERGKQGQYETREVIE